MTVKGEPKTYKYNSSTGKVFLDVINYGSKTEETVEPGDDISISTENFKVFYNQNCVIKAMPHYSLVLTTDNKIKQGPAVEGISSFISSKFSTTNYWTQGEESINMNDSRNLIQPYINDYKKTLEELGAYGVEVRIPIYSELNLDGITDRMRYPKNDASSYWIGTSDPERSDALYYQLRYGHCTPNSYVNTRGVRPIIIIEY